MEPLQPTPSEQTGNTSTVRAPPVEFKAVSPSVHVHHPSPKVKAADTQGILAPIRPKNAALSPNIILIMGWMNAPLRLVSKYAAPYALLFPAATTIVQLSTGVTFIQKKKAHEQSFKHVINLLQDINTSEKAKSDMHDNIRSLQDGPQQSELTLDSDSQKGLKKLPDETNSSKANPQPKQAGLLIHSFSDGGAYNLSQLLRQLKGKATPVPLALVFDSSPGKASAYSGSTAFTMSLANRPWVRLIVRAAIYVYLKTIYSFKRLIGSQTWSEIMRQQLNSPRFWQTAGTPSKAQGSLPPRFYLYSKTDALIDYRAVEAHAAEAAKVQGLVSPLQLQDLQDTIAKQRIEPSKIVALRRWDNVQHCDIGRADFSGYWTSVRKFLETVL